MSTFKTALRNYLSVRRSLGYKLIGNEYVLREFVVFLEHQRVPYITTELVLRWLEGYKSLPRRTQCLCFVRDFARYQKSADSRTETPPPRLLPYRYPRRTPYLYSEEEICRLLAYARKLPLSSGLDRWTYPTLFGLLTATGLRVSEACNLHRGDVDLQEGVLTIRLTKFKKSRLVPLHTSTTGVLRRYASRRDRSHSNPATPFFFLSSSGGPLSTFQVRSTFTKILTQIGLRHPTGRSPHLHDLRHRFAVTTLMAWYRSGQNVEQRLPTLSTYLGHINITSTYWYLSAIPELLCLSAKRLEKRWEGR